MNSDQVKKYKVDHNKVDDLCENMNQVFEATSQAFTMQENVTLSLGAEANDYDKWKKRVDSEREGLKKNLDKSAKAVTKIVEAATKDTIKQANKQMLEIDKDLSKPSAILIKEQQKAVMQYSKSVLKDFDDKVNKIYKLRNQEPLFDAIAKYTDKSRLEQAPKIVYSDGKQVNFRSYMEMNIRTTIKQEINENLFQASANNGVVFYLGSSFADCAKDHLMYDGKMFYDANWQSFGYDEETSDLIQEYIDSHNLMTYQEAIEGTFTTRPNCRHTLTPMPIDEVISKPVKQLLQENHLEAVSPRNDTNYLITQKQRYLERQIRMNKQNLETHKMIMKNAPSEKIQNHIANDQRAITAHQRELQALIKKYGEENGGFLRRDYRRENPAIVVQDAGVRYTVGIRGASNSQLSKLIEDQQIIVIK